MDDTAPPITPLDTPHGEGNREPHGDDEWLSINAAARRLGVTATAILNKRGTPAARPNGNFGKLVRVPLTVTGTVGLTAKESAPGIITHTVALTVLVDQVNALRATLAKAEGELDVLRERAGQMVILEAQITWLHAAAALLNAQIDDVRGERERWCEQFMQIVRHQPPTLSDTAPPTASPELVGTAAPADSPLGAPAPAPRPPRRRWWWWRRSA